MANRRGKAENKELNGENYIIESINGKHQNENNHGKNLCSNRLPRFSV